MEQKMKDLEAENSFLKECIRIYGMEKKANLENYIHKDKIKEKLKELEFSEIAYGGRSIGKTLSYGKKIGKLEVLTDLLKEE